MTRFNREDAPLLVREARTDASLTQAELAGMTGMSQSTLAQIEAGKRAVSTELLEKILRAADYRPSLPLARYAPSISRYAMKRGLDSLRVFGSIAQGTDGFESDIDLIGTPTRELSLLSWQISPRTQANSRDFLPKFTRIHKYPRLCGTSLTRPCHYERAPVFYASATRIKETYAQLRRR